MAFFRRKKTTDLAKIREQQSFAEERLVQAKILGRERAQAQAAKIRRGGGGIGEVFVGIAKRADVEGALIGRGQRGKKKRRSNLRGNLDNVFGGGF